MTNRSLASFHVVFSLLSCAFLLRNKPILFCRHVFFHAPPIDTQSTGRKLWRNTSYIQTPMYSWPSRMPITTYTKSKNLLSTTAYTKSKGLWSTTAKTKTKCLWSSTAYTKCKGLWSTRAYTKSKCFMSVTTYTKRKGLGSSTTHTNSKGLWSTTAYNRGKGLCSNTPNTRSKGLLSTTAYTQSFSVWSLPYMSVINESDCKLGIINLRDQSNISWVDQDINQNTDLKLHQLHKFDFFLIIWIHFHCNSRKKTIILTLLKAGLFPTFDAIETLMMSE